MRAEGQVIAKLKEIVPDLIALYYFGSQEHGAVHKASDIDLAFLAQKPMASVERFDLEQELATLCQQSVDLIDLRKASTVLRMQVISTGRCLISVKDAEKERFETLVYSAYARLNEERGDILRDVQKRGSVHAR